MDIYDIFFYLALAAGFWKAFNLGANDVANSMASAVGAKAITVRQAVVIAGILNFVGAVLLGSQVTKTIAKGIIDPMAIGDPKLVMIGMFAALIAAAFWVFMATLTSLPVSSTHSIVGAILGFGIVAGGASVVNWYVLGAVVASWFISPFFSAAIGFLVFTHIRSRILNARQFIVAAKKWAPRWIGLTIGIICMSFMYKTPLGKSLKMPLYMAFFWGSCFGVVAWGISRFFVARLVMDEEAGAEAVERIFRKMQIGTSCYVALAHGANDVANAIGPVAAIYLIAKDQTIATQAEIPFTILAIGGIGIAVGILLLGHRVMTTVGEKITVLNNTRGFAVDFSTATTVLAASKLGLPVSSTHAAIGAIAGVGVARGFKAVDFRILGKIVIYWLITVPVSAFTAVILFEILKWLCYN
ncbi:inorganic phosphate transporter [Pseudodesulfovibrio piezophilus]|uniref:Phosphate transporter n=1 Tax=Pseudodesulfovibrio piezophilus (strain DSM 21447 / JCM 15486 / C1TLV30) TaxID=1322246 RepID=M1WK28_PSEP2|nr:inorganic phosphate transporter [Pseudodesulfovibrio piezophilus]CCH48876.1 conserved membrane protein of unknown function [Pseudodesulfovibrio piezophilus C1TLV30]